MDDLKFSVYGTEFMAFISLQELIEDKDDLMVRIEESGSEGYYVEVAMWNDTLHIWQRYCFLKLLGGEVEELDALTIAKDVKKKLNEAWGTEYVSFIHGLNNYSKE